MVPGFTAEAALAAGGNHRGVRQHQSSEASEVFSPAFSCGDHVCTCDGLLDCIDMFYVSSSCTGGHSACHGTVCGCDY
jgi:hypothetical protein